MVKEVYRNRSAVIRVSSLDSRDDIVAVSFSPWAEEPNIDALGWAEKLFENRNWPGVHVVAADNHWYQPPGIREIIDHVAEICARYDRVITYGSSMGGYAALNFADAIGAEIALAVMPQFSVDRLKVPFETRWPKSADLEFNNDTMSVVRANGFAIFDPWFRLDRLHADLLAAQNVRLVPLPLMGHVGPGPAVLKAALDLVAAGETEGLPERLRGIYRAARKDNPAYYFRMAMGARGMSAGRREAILRCALRRWPENALLQRGIVEAL